MTPPSERLQKKDPAKRLLKRGQTTLSTAACLHGVNSLQAGTEQSDPFPY